MKREAVWSEWTRGMIHATIHVTQNDSATWIVAPANENVCETLQPEVQTAVSRAALVHRECSILMAVRAPHYSAPLVAVVASAPGAGK